MPMNSIDPKSREVTPEMVIAKLKEHGQTVTKAEAKVILDFMYKNRRSASNAMDIQNNC
jgi:hypothetical protein